MDGEAIISVSAAVVTLTQFAKWGGVDDKHGPLVVMALSVLGVALWGFSKGTWAYAQSFDYFAGWVAVTTSAAGVFGFTRAASTAITSTKEPPKGGAGSSPTEKMEDGK